MSGDFLELTGTVVDESRGGFYRVQIGDPLNRVVLCKLCGRMSKFRIRVLPGDLVTVEVGPFDPSRGRISFRGLRREGAA